LPCPPAFPIRPPSPRPWLSGRGSWLLSCRGWGGSGLPQRFRLACVAADPVAVADGRAGGGRGSDVQLFFVGRPNGRQVQPVGLDPVSLFPLLSWVGPSTDRRPAT